MLLLLFRVVLVSGTLVRLLRPDLICDRSPFLRVGIALLAEVIYALRRLKVCLVSPGCLNDLAKKLRVLQHRAGTKVIAVERLTLVISHEQRALEHLQNGVVMDVGVGEVDEHARLRITVGVDVEVVAASCNTSADEFTVVLEVHGIEADVAVLAADLTDSLDHVFTLLYGRHKLGSCIVANRHQMEIEAKARTLFLQHVEEVIAGDCLNVGSGVADRSTEYNAVLLQKIHSLHNSGIMTLAAAGIVGVRCALDGQHEGDVAKLLDSLTHGIGDQSGVGVQGEEAVVMLFRKTENIVHADSRLTACHHVQVCAEILTLGDNLVHILKGKI